MNIDIYKTSKDTVCVIETVINDQTRTFVGMAKCHPDDKYRAVVGEHIAAGRAFEKYGRALSKVGNGLMMHYEEIDSKRPTIIDEEKAASKRLRTKVKNKKKKARRKLLRA